MPNLRAVFVFASVTFVSLDCCNAQNPIFELLTNQGVTTARDENVRLPLPTLIDGLAAAQQRKAVERIADAGHPWDQLTRKSAVAPFVFKFDAGRDKNWRTARRIDLWFVVYGNLKTLGSDEFQNKHFMIVGAASDPENRSSVRLIPESEIGRTFSKHWGEPRCYSLEFNILDRVRITTTTCNVKTETKDSILSASILYPGSDEGHGYPEQWQPITRDVSGRRKIGPPQRYTGFGAYAKATPLVGLPGAIFVEYHLAFAEPAEWFGGEHFLDSKMPFLAQYIVRDLRQGLVEKRR